MRSGQENGRLCGIRMDEDIPSPMNVAGAGNSNRNMDLAPAPGL